MLVGCDKAQSGPSAELQAQQNTAFQAMLKDPGNLETVMAYAQAATKAGDYEAAVSAYEGMLIIDSNLPRVRLELGILYYRLKSYETSRTYLETALASPTLPGESANRPSCCWRRCPSNPSHPGAPDLVMSAKEIVMSKSNVVVLLLLRAALVGVAGLTLFTTAHAQSRIGVTQATENNPMGKPPGGLDRVLRVGTDVQANEIITTAANDRAHLVFLDGTTLTVGPSSQLTVDKFVYDPTTQKGELAVNATKGVFRVIGGRISKTSAITVTTPSATMGIRGGIMVFGVQASATTSIFVYGNSMTVTANGVTQTVTVPGLSVSTPTGGTPGAPTIVVQGDLAAALAALASNTTAAAATVDAIQHARRQQPRQRRHAAGPHPGDRHCEYGYTDHLDHHHDHVVRHNGRRKSEPDPEQS